jgi:hypothetical protein
MIEITMSKQYGSGWKRWSVSAKVQGLPPRVVTSGLAKGKAQAWVDLLNRLLKFQSDNLDLDSVLMIRRRRGLGHGHCSIVLGAQRGERAVWAGRLTSQAARSIRDELNPVLSTFREIRYEATVVNALRDQLADNMLLLQQCGEGPAVQALIGVNNELRNQIRRLECGTHSQNRIAA